MQNRSRDDITATCFQVWRASHASKHQEEGQGRWASPSVQLTESPVTVWRLELWSPSLSFSFQPEQGTRFGSVTRMLRPREQRFGLAFPSSLG